MRIGFMLGLLWLSFNVWADTQALQSIHEIRSRGYLLCASAMVYFSPQVKDPDPRSLASYFDSLNQLQTKNVQLGQPEGLSVTLDQMAVLLDSLEHMRRRDAAQYPEKISQLLTLQRRLDDWAAEQYQIQGGKSDDLTLSLHRQSLDIARLLFDYQARWYGISDNIRMAFPLEQRVSLDGEIQKRFEKLVSQYPESAERIDKLSQNYRYVRAQLLDANPSLQQGGVEFYLVRNVIDLDELATQSSVTKVDDKVSVNR